MKTSCGWKRREIERPRGMHIAMVNSFGDMTGPKFVLGIAISQATVCRVDNALK
jgi:hypothetical protein